MKPGTAPAGAAEAGKAPKAPRTPKAPEASTFVPLRTDDVTARPDLLENPKTAPAGPGTPPGDRKPAAPAARPGSGRAPAAPPGTPKPATAPGATAPGAPVPAAPGGAGSGPRTAVPAPGSRAAVGPAWVSERTTQQPLPPRPPLDMLADLTNNPPPPPSALRTAVRRFKIYAPLVALLVIILGVVQLVRPLPAPTLVMSAKSSYTFPGAAPELVWPTEGQAYMAAAGLGTLGQSGEQKPVPIASVTKSMTAYIILRDHPIKKGEKGAMIDIDKTAETEGKKNNSTDNESTLDTVKEGDKISEYDAIAALMIPSANNIARLLARWDAGSQEAFVKKMNDTAKELGMTRTTYTDPSGLDATTVSTAEDQVKLGLKLVEMETLLDITKKPSWVDPSGKNWPNWNRLVPFNDSLGIKTGTTTKAGGNLLFAAQKKIGNTNQLIVGAVLGQHKPAIIDTVIAASKQLMISTQKSLNGASVVKKGDVVGYVDDGLGGRTPVVATADVQAVGWATLTVDIKLGDGGGKLPQTAKAGTEVGVLTVGEGVSQVKVPVALRGELATPGIGSKLTRVG
ncbi:D-alanyl-D-alanine carboxypeptidase [Streptomyces sp. NPDC051567]|uniref:D-alanyl-D-alanine carboxypeptidase n=1 Tax=Streptomyces sp. NPDC051567 TaxID=3365660 RepID=UPI0037B94098